MKTSKTTQKGDISRHCPMLFYQMIHTHPKLDYQSLKLLGTEAVNINARVTFLLPVLKFKKSITRVILLYTFPYMHVRSSFLCA